MAKNETREQQAEVRRLKDEKKAIILSHFYQRGEVQEIGDFLGDSLELCRKAASINDKDIIVFNGVDFMAETASIVNPEPTIIHPVLNAKCPMANMLKAEDVRRYRNEYPNAEVVLYVNTLAEAKAEADVMCTSANAVKVVSNIDNDQILFGPDANLAMWVRKHCPDKEIIPIPVEGYCYVHTRFSEADIMNWRNRLPKAKIIVHPECKTEVQDLADAVCSTSQTVSFVESSNVEDFIIGTEIGLIDYLKREIPQKRFHPLLPAAICDPMKSIFLRNVIDSLKNEHHVIKVDDGIADKARKAIARMFELTV